MSRSPTSSLASYLVIAQRSGGGGTTLKFRAARSRAALSDSFRRERMKVAAAISVPGFLSGGGHLGGGHSRTLKLADHAVLNDQLFQLLSRGVPLVEALEVVSQTVAVSARPRIEKIRQQVAAGANFADACKSAGGFDNVTCAVYRAAERTGDLAGAAKQLAITSRRILAVAGRAGTMLIYPIIVITVSLLVASVMMVVVVPMLGTQLIDAGISLPGYTKVMIGMGTWMEANIGLLLLGVLGLIVAAVIVRDKIVRFFGVLLRGLPLFREVALAQESARFFTVMAAMSRSGVPLADALMTANQAVNHPGLRTQMERLRVRLVEGGVLRLLIDDVTALPLATRRLLIAAERAGDLESAFNSLAGDMTDEVDRRSSRLLAILQPLLIVVMFVIIGTLLASVMVPLLTLSSKMASGTPGS